MRCIRLEAGLKAQCRQKWTVNFFPIAQRQFHSAPILNKSNPYSKRPEKLPEPAEVAPKGPPSDRDHGLYKFFRNKKSITPAAISQNSGRAWTAEELRQKSFKDLHVLWYKCLLERNVIATEVQDAKFQNILEEVRILAILKRRAIKQTMRRIKFVLWERYRAWWGAHQLHKENPKYARKIAATAIQKPSVPKTVKKVKVEDDGGVPKELTEVVEKTPEEIEEEKMARKEAADLAKRLAEAERQRQEAQAVYEKRVQERKAQQERVVQSQFGDLDARAEKEAERKKKQ